MVSRSCHGKPPSAEHLWAQQPVASGAPCGPPGRPCRSGTLPSRPAEVTVVLCQIQGNPISRGPGGQPAPLLTPSRCIRIPSVPRDSQRLNGCLLSKDTQRRPLQEEELSKRFLISFSLLSTDPESQDKPRVRASGSGGRSPPSRVSSDRARSTRGSGKQDHRRARISGGSAEGVDMGHSLTSATRDRPQLQEPRDSGVGEAWVWVASLSLPASVSHVGHGTAPPSEPGILEAGGRGGLALPPRSCLADTPQSPASLRPPALRPKGRGDPGTTRLPPPRRGGTQGAAPPLPSSRGIFPMIPPAGSPSQFVGQAWVTRWPTPITGQVAQDWHDGSANHKKLWAGSRLLLSEDFQAPRRVRFWSRCTVERMFQKSPCRPRGSSGTH